MIIIRSLLIIPLAIIMLLSSCAYEKMNSPDRKKFHITEINTQGERRAAFIIQKKILTFQGRPKNQKNNRTYGGTPVFSEKLDCFLFFGLPGKHQLFVEF